MSNQKGKSDAARQADLNRRLWRELDQILAEQWDVVGQPDQANWFLALVEREERFYRHWERLRRFVRRRGGPDPEPLLPAGLSWEDFVGRKQEINRRTGDWRDMEFQADLRENIREQIEFLKKKSKK